jgi:hypothetical protein
MTVFAPHCRDAYGLWSLAEGDSRRGKPHLTLSDVHRSERQRDCRLSETHFRLGKEHFRAPMRFGVSPMAIGEPAKRISASPTAIGEFPKSIFARQWESEPWQW